MKSTVLALTVLLTAVAAAAQPKVIEGIVVRVNDRILDISDMQLRAREQTAETGRPVTPDGMQQLVSQAADELVLLERADEQKMTITDDEVTAAVQQLKEQNHISDEAAFDQLLQSLGITIDQLRRRLHDSILINRVLSKEVGELPITESELRERFDQDKESFRVPEQVHLEHVVFPVTDEATRERAKATAARLVAAVRAGGNFLSLIEAQVKDGTTTGGDLGTLAVTDLRDEVREAVAKLKPGEISDPFVSAAGVHVVRLVERIPPSIPPFKDVQDKLRAQVLEERYRNRLRSVVDDLKKRYVVETHPELMAGS